MLQYISDVVGHSSRSLVAKYVLHFVNLLTNHRMQIWPFLTVVLQVCL